MCGIVGLFLKNPALRPALGQHVSAMLAAMTDRGPDSAGIGRGRVQADAAPSRPRP